MLPSGGSAGLCACVDGSREDAGVLGNRRSAPGESVALRLVNMITLTTTVINARRGIARFLLWVFLWPVLAFLVAVKWAVRHPLITGVVVIPGALWLLGHPGYAVAALVTAGLLTPVIRLAWPQWKARMANSAD